MKWIQHLFVCLCLNEYVCVCVCVLHLIVFGAHEEKIHENMEILLKSTSLVSKSFVNCVEKTI